MTLLVVSFLAGVLTVLAPCILPLLPVVIGSSLSGRHKSTPYIVVGSLALSILIFTFLLKASTAFIMVPPEVWTYLSGGILILFGVTLVLPSVWEMLPGVGALAIGSNKLVGEGYQKKSFIGDVLIGAALGPVFSTCSPTYFVILATVLPVSFIEGTTYLLAYILGLAGVLLLIAKFGQRLSGTLAVIADSHGWFKRIIGILFIILGIAIATGYEKKLETKILDSGYFDITKVEHFLLKKIQENPESSMPDANAQRYVEIKNPAGFVNTDGITIGELIGKKVILVDFMTYSCINCQRTFPYMVAWDAKYRGKGLAIIGIHTPEFAFEKDIQNVRDAMKRFGITYPVVLDNEYATWNAYKNNYWPRKYLIDLKGNIVYDHIGEGGYEETERKIQELLGENNPALAVSNIQDKEIFANSPETYFGSLRNELLGNGRPGTEGVQSFRMPAHTSPNTLYLSGVWNITPEYAEAVQEGGVQYTYQAKDVYIVAEAEHSMQVDLIQDGIPIATITIQESRLYTLIENDAPGKHKLEIRTKGPGVRLYAFTFG
jgi:cytochrome c biogenesis protein CcdA/thiol-disulfide isomerase/thioredoxin